MSLTGHRRMAELVALPLLALARACNGVA
jgi:hypothetical protein